MRTITKRFALRLEAQANEAKVQGLNKVAEHISDIINTSQTRDSGSSYTYAKEDFKKDIERSVWQGVVRAADFFNCNIDAIDIQDVVSKIAKSLADEVRIKGGVKHGVGAYEPNVPGEVRETVILEIED